MQLPCLPPPGTSHLGSQSRADGDVAGNLAPGCSPSPSAALPQPRAAGGGCCSQTEPYAAASGVPGRTRCVGREQAVSVAQVGVAVPGSSHPEDLGLLGIWGGSAQPLLRVLPSSHGGGSASSPLTSCPSLVLPRHAQGRTAAPCGTRCAPLGLCRSPVWDVQGPGPAARSCGQWRGAPAATSPLGSSSGARSWNILHAAAAPWARGARAL